ncbi:hypothetical protein LCGC14_2891440 [marine sediment metagenome]|uniref:Uncharacterized protein n=1 Tax=marine sediment metagenome TaxID=412755 RepID=A0A0F8XX45_9ZZZZ
MKATMFIQEKAGGDDPLVATLHIEGEEHNIRAFLDMAQGVEITLYKVKAESEMDKAAKNIVSQRSLTEEERKRGLELEENAQECLARRHRP